MSGYDTTATNLRDGKAVYFTFIQQQQQQHWLLVFNLKMVFFFNFFLAFLSAEDCNFISVDWEAAAGYAN